MFPSTSDLAAKDLFKNFPFNKYTLEEFARNVTYTFPDIVAMYAYKGSGLRENIVVRSSFYTKRGLCHTIIPKEPVDAFSVKTGYWLYLKHTTKDKSKDTNGLSTSGFEIHIHDQKEIKDDVSIDMNYLYLESAEDMYVTLNAQTYSQVSTGQEPCNNELGYSRTKCEEKCVHNYVADKIGCTVPWLRQLDQNYTECNNSIAINEIAVLLGDYNNFNRKDILLNCYCPRSCNNTIYKYQIESRRDCDAIQSPSSTISIYFPTDLITEHTEVLSYDWNFFLADVGGSLGFLLGLSVIGFVNVIEELIKMVINRRQPEEEEKEVNDEGQKAKSVMEFEANCDMYQHMQEKKMMEEKY